MSSSLPQLPTLRLILAARTAGLPKELERTGFYPMPAAEALGSLEEAGLWFGPRPVLEDTPEFRQIVPYIVVACGSDIVRYRRTVAGNEARLHGKLSVGLGGHVDLTDLSTAGDAIDLLGTLEKTAKRELEEELGNVECESKEWIGLLVENESAVGRVHIGLVGLWRANAMPNGLTEDAIGEVSLSSVAELGKNKERLEQWSLMLLPWLAEEMAAN